MIKHVVWTLADGPNKETRGRVGVSFDSADHVTLVNLGNYMLPAVLLLPVLNEALGDGWIDKAEKLHRHRDHPWKIEVHKGLSGACDYRLRVLENEDWLYMPVKARLHVSMYSKLNEGLRSVWLGDLAPLLASFLEEFPPPKKGYGLKASEPEPIIYGFTQAGDSSGLPELLESMKAMEVLADADTAY